MNRKRKTEIFLILIEVDIPLVLFFFQDYGDLDFGSLYFKVIERKLNPDEIKAYEEEKLLLEKNRK